MGHRDPPQLFNSPSLDRALQPKDDPFGARGVQPWMSGVGSEVSGLGQYEAAILAGEVPDSLSEASRNTKTRRLSCGF